MGKRAALMRAAAKPHAANAGGYKSATKKKIKKKLRVKPQRAAVATAAVSVAAAASSLSDDMFALALPTAAPRPFLPPHAAGKKPPSKQAKRKSRFELPAEMPAVEPVAAFGGDATKESMLRSILAAAKGADGGESALIPADAHRQRCINLKAKKLERAAKKAERWRAHKKC